jgi:Cu+-exporting ATPase
VFGRLRLKDSAMNDQGRISPPLAPPPATDPVCGMTVDPATAAASFTYEGQPYYFCCTHCLERFRADPKHYLDKKSSPAPATPAPAGTEYTCPMHPQVITSHPGSCPICGMALEPRMPAAEEGPHPELVDMRRRLLVGVVLSVPILLLAMADLLPGKPLQILDETVLNWAQLVLATPVVLWCGWPFFARAWASLLNRSPNMFTLIALGIGAAYGDSLVATVAPQLYPESFRMAGGGVATYFDTACAITVLVLVGQVLELRARGQTGEAIRRLLRLAPPSARLIRADGGEADVPLEQLQPGDLLRA